MNWRLIFLLSLFGLFMAFATVFWITTDIEPLFWLIIFLVCAYVIAKYAPGKFFFHGFMTSIFNSIWITVIHYIFFDTYITLHTEEMGQYEQMHTGMPVREMMLIMGPFIGVVSGLILGLFCFIAAKIMKRKPVIS
jgi:hypothetical protein